MSLGNEVDAVFRREVKSLPAFEKAQLRLVLESHRRSTR